MCPSKSCSPDAAGQPTDVVVNAVAKTNPAVIQDRCSLHQTYSGIRVEEGESPITQLMYLIWAQRPDLKRQYDLSNPKSRQKFRAWYKTQGALELDLVHWLADCSSAPKEHPRSYGEVAKNLVIHFRPLQFIPLIGTLWRWNSPITRRIEKFGLTIGLRLRNLLVSVAKRLPDFAGLIRTEKLIPIPATTRGLLHPLLNLSAVDDLEIRQRPLTDPNLPEKGVNVIGYAYGELGLGEDTRTVAAAMSSQNAPVGVVNFDRGLFTRSQDMSAKQWISRECRYLTNLFPMAVNEVHSAVLDIGINNYDRRYNIGYVPWELPRWPEAWMNYLDLLDEFWVSTNFTFNSLRPYTDKPVRLMPLAVTMDQVAPVKRSDFGLPDDTFLFFFSFDITSSVHRKNPFATIEAFRRAFPRGNEPVGLVMKVMNLDPLVPNWHRLTKLAAGDNRIHFLTRMLSRPTLMGLVSQCDAYVSLHRSEGFGRGPAEAMLLGKPTIVTGFSGNVDFTKPDNSCLVDYKLVDVKPHEYHFAENQQWADADVDHAAEHMRRLAEDQEFAQRLGRAGRDQILTHHSSEAAGKRYFSRLSELGLL